MAKHAKSPLLLTIWNSCHSEFLNLPVIWSGLALETLPLKPKLLRASLSPKPPCHFHPANPVRQLSGPPIHLLNYALFSASSGTRYLTKVQFFDYFTFQVPKPRRLVQIACIGLTYGYRRYANSRFTSTCLRWPEAMLLHGCPYRPPDCHSEPLDLPPGQGYLI